MLAEEYIGFLDLLWKRVRPDLLFPPPPRLEADKPPPLFSTAMTKDGKPTSRRVRRKKGKRSNQKQRGASNRPLPVDTGTLSSPPAARDDVENSGGGGGTAKMNFYAKFNRPHPPPPVPPPRTPEGLLVLRIPGFRPNDAQRAAWVGSGGYIDPGVSRMLKGEIVKKVEEKGAEGDKTGAEQQPQKGEKQEEEEPGWKQRRRRRLLAAGIVEGGERPLVSSRTVRDEDGPKNAVKTAEELDSVWDFAARSFPLDPQEVSTPHGIWDTDGSTLRA